MAEKKLTKYRKYVKDIVGFVEMDATTALGMRITTKTSSPKQPQLWTPSIRPSDHGR